MNSLKSEFKFLDRGYKDTLVLIPGWATDYRIFSTLDLNYNYILPMKLHPFAFSQQLLEFLNQKSLAGISLFGWSMGAFLAVEFALNNYNKADELILLSLRMSYETKALEEIKHKLLKNKKAFLYKFYLDCFSDDDKEALIWFKKNLLKGYTEETSLDELIAGLDYLSCASINPESLASVKNIRIFHGIEDRIAPVQEVNILKKHLPKTKFVYLANAGHIPFLGEDFKNVFCNG